MKIISLLRYMMNRNPQPEFYFTLQNTWDGGFYELEIEVGEHSDERLLAALRTTWNHPTLTGCYLHTDIEPHAQSRLVPNLDHWDTEHLLGIAQIPNGKRVACGTIVSRFDDADWLGLYVPMGALSQAYPVGAFPFSEDAEPHEIWRKPIELWLAEIGQAVYNVVPFRFGLIDFEIDYVDWATLRSEGIPEQRRMGYLWPENGNLKHYPRNLVV